MKVLVADRLEETGRRGLAAAGCEVLYEPELEGDALRARVVECGADVLVVRSTNVPRAVLESGRLSLVVRAGAGVNTIDVQAASEHAIWVANCPGKNAIAVAELTFALVLALDRHVVEGAADLRAGKWNKKEYSKARGLYGRTLGVLGVGSIGREVIRRARVFGMNVVGWSRSLDEARANDLGISRCATARDVAAACDVLSVHLALSPQTRGLVGEAVLGAMRPGTYLVNTSRHEVIDEEALIRCVRERGLRVGVDVFADEPSGGTGVVRSPLLDLPGVVGSHHIGASTEQAQEAIAEEAARIVRVYSRTGRAPNVVNQSLESRSTHLLVVRHYDRVGVLAGVFDCLKRAGINVQETENVVFEGGSAAVARIHLSSAPAADVLAALRSASDVLDVSLVAL
jgi:D-3-phosphoglycerate dehydrogenase